MRLDLTFVTFFADLCTVFFSCALFIMCNILTFEHRLLLAAEQPRMELISISVYVSGLGYYLYSYHTAWAHFVPLEAVKIHQKYH